MNLNKYIVRCMTALKLGCKWITSLFLNGSCHFVTMLYKILSFCDNLMESQRVYFLEEKEKEILIF